MDEGLEEVDHLVVFERHALQCGLDLNVALNDVMDSMEEANGAVARLDADRSDADLWGAVAGAWSRWWSVFLRQYGGKCFSRWRDKCGSWRDYQRMEELWAECFVPLQAAGCDIAKRIRLSDVKQEIIDVSRDPEIRRTQSKALLQWARRLDDTLSKLIASHTQLQKQTITRSLKDLAESERDSRLAKLKRSIFGRGR